MAGDVSDFMKLWTQGDPLRSACFRNSCSSDWTKSFRARATCWQKSRSAAASGPVVRWMEEWGYPSQLLQRFPETF